MAFRILSNDEIELLTDAERNSYERELAVYNDRVKFVEQIEKFESAEITPYEPKFINVSVIGRVPEKIYSNQNYAAQLIDVAVKPAPTAHETNFEKTAAAVPKCPKVKNVPVEHIKKIQQHENALPQMNKVFAPVVTNIEAKHDIPTLPEIGKTSAPPDVCVRLELNNPVLPATEKTIVPCKKFKKIEQVKPSVANKIKLQSFPELDFTVAFINSKAINKYKPDIMQPRIKSREFTLPEREKPVLPLLSAGYKKVKRFEAPEKANPHLPKTVITGKANILFKQMKKTQIQLPEVSNISAAAPSFSELNIQQAKLPATHKVNVPAKKFLKSDCVLSDLPKLTVPRTQIQLYIEPELQNPDLPIFAKPTVTSVPHCKNFADRIPELQHPSIGIIPIQSYKKVDSKINNIPSVKKVSVPDAYSNNSIKSLLP